MYHCRFLFVWREYVVRFPLPDGYFLPRDHRKYLYVELYDLSGLFGISYRVLRFFAAKARDLDFLTPDHRPVIFRR